MKTKYSIVNKVYNKEMFQLVKEYFWMLYFDFIKNMVSRLYAEKIKLKRLSE